MEKVALANYLRGAGNRETEPSSSARNTGLALGGAGGGLLGGVGGLAGHDFLMNTVTRGENNARLRDVMARHPGKLNTLSQLARRIGPMALRHDVHKPGEKTLAQLLLRLARVVGTPGRMAGLGAGTLGLLGAGVFGGLGAGADKLRR